MRAVNQEIKDAIKKLKIEVGDYDAVRKQKDKLIRQRETIQKLQTKRGGPVHVLRELSDILGKDRDRGFAIFSRCKSRRFRLESKVVLAGREDWSSGVSRHNDSRLQDA